MQIQTLSETIISPEEIAIQWMFPVSQLQHKWLSFRHSYLVFWIWIWFLSFLIPRYDSTHTFPGLQL